MDLTNWFTKKLKRDPWERAVTPACCEKAKVYKYELVFYGWEKHPPSWAIEMEGTGVDDILFCPWCGMKLPTAEELEQAWKERQS